MTNIHDPFSNVMVVQDTTVCIKREVAREILSKAKATRGAKIIVLDPPEWTK